MKPTIGSARCQRCCSNDKTLSSQHGNRSAETLAVLDRSRTSCEKPVSWHRSGSRRLLWTRRLRLHRVRRRTLESSPVGLPSSGATWRRHVRHCPMCTRQIPHIRRYRCSPRVSDGYGLGGSPGVECFSFSWQLAVAPSSCMPALISPHLNRMAPPRSRPSRRLSSTAKFQRMRQPAQAPLEHQVSTRCPPQRPVRTPRSTRRRPKIRRFDRRSHDLLRPTATDGRRSRFPRATSRVAMRPRA